MASTDPGPPKEPESLESNQIASARLVRHTVAAGVRCVGVAAPRRPQCVPDQGELSTVQLAGGFRNSLRLVDLTSLPAQVGAKLRDGAFDHSKLVDDEVGRVAPVG